MFSRKEKKSVLCARMFVLDEKFEHTMMYNDVKCVHIPNTSVQSSAQLTPISLSQQSFTLKGKKRNHIVERGTNEKIGIQINHLKSNCIKKVVIILSTFLPF